MSGKPQNQEYGILGGVVNLDVFFYDSPGGNLVDDDNYASSGTLPSVSIYAPSDLVDPIETGQGTRIGVGSYLYAYNIAEDAEVSDEWVIKWEITINGYTKEFTEYFRVIQPGVGIPESKRDIPDTDNIIALRHRIADWKGGDDTSWVFYNSELQSILTNAVSEHSGKAESEIDAGELSLSLILAHASVAEILATDTAKFFKYREGASGDEVDKSMTPETFIKLASHLRNSYLKKIKQNSDDIEIGTNITNGAKVVSRAGFFKVGNIPQTLGG